MSKKNEYDIIIIGSGIGALTLASFMSKVNRKKVLIFERHFQIGGYTHTFRRKKYKWDTGLHHVGRVFGGLLPELIFNFITNKKLKWRRISEPFERLVYPDLIFNVFGNENTFKKDIIKQFPDDKKALRKYFKDVKTVSRWFTLYYLTRFVPSFLRIPLQIVNNISKKKALQTTGNYLNENISNPKLRAVLTSQWGNYGLPPSKSAFVMHAIVVNHFITGGYYPKGGPEEIAKSIMPNIEKHGGCCLIKHNVNKIIIENGKAIGVRVENMTKTNTEISDYYAPVIVSNAGVFNTYTKLIPENIHIPFRKKIAGMNSISQCVALYVGLKDNIRTLGIKASNHWIFSTYNHDKNYLNKNIVEGKPSSCYLSTMTNRDENRPVNTAIIIAYVNFDVFKQWQHQKSGRRDREYYLLKKKISKGLISFVNERYPGFNELIDYAELATPLTSEHFTAHPEGAMYGFPATPERYKHNWIKVSTPIEGLYMTGADVSGLGVVCSMLGGFATACFLNGSFGLFKLMAKVKRYNRT